MRLKLKSDKSISEFLKGIVTPKIALIIGLGLLILIFAGLPSFDTEEPEPLDEITAICSSVGGVGRCRVITTTDSDGDIAAVAVLCDGADSVEVRNRLCRLISSLYGIGYNRISILKISE